MSGKFKKSSIYFDEKPIKGSNNAVTSDGIAKAIEAGGGGVTVDNELSVVSGNPVQNKVITNKINDMETDIDNIEAVIPSGATTSNKLATASDVQGNADKIGDLAQLQTTVKTDLVNALNEVASGGGGGGLKYKWFASKQTTGTITIGGVSYVTFPQSTIKSWFDTIPSSIYAVIALKMSGNVVKVAINSGTAFVMEESSSAVTYDFVGVFYE